jgi:ABC-type Na+ efflux pump permease subunit
MKKSSLAQFIKSHRLLVVIAGFAIVVALAFGLPSFVSDGTENFSGKELEIAKAEVDEGYEWQSSDVMPRPPAFKGKVKKVYKQEPEKKCGSSEKPGVVYVVEVARITFFGLESGGYGQPVCGWSK